MENGGLFRKHYGLNARNIEALTAAHILTHHQVIFAQHVRTGLGETSPVALIGARWQLALLGAHDPGNFILRGLMAMRTVQRCWFLLGALVEKLTFFHSVALALAVARLRAAGIGRPTSIITGLGEASYGKMDAMARKKKKVKRFRAVQAVKALARERIGIPPALQVVPDKKRKEPEKHKLTLGKMLEDA